MLAAAGQIATSLTISQKALLLYLGGTREDDRVISQETLQELVALGLVYERGPNHFDMTDLGERVYRRLVAANPTFSWDPLEDRR